MQLHALAPSYKIFYTRKIIIADKYMENLKQASGEI